MPPWQLLDAIHKLVLPTCQSTVRREWQLGGKQFEAATVSSWPKRQGRGARIAVGMRLSPRRPMVPMKPRPLP